MANWIYNLLHGKLPDQGFLGRGSTGAGAGELLSPSQATDLLPAATPSNDGKMTAAQAGKLEQFSAESEYVRLGGRAGGQTLYGGSETGNDLTLNSNTSNDGSVKIGSFAEFDEANEIFSLTDNTRTIPPLGDLGGVVNTLATDGKWGLLTGLYSGGAWIQSQRVDGIATAYPLKIQPNGGNLIIGSTATPTARVQSIGSTSDSSGYGLKVDGSTANTKNFYVRNDGRLETRDGGELSAGTTIGFKIGISTSEKLGFFGATPVAQQNALTASLTTLTHSAPGTPDYTIQDLTDSGGYGFATQDEGNTVLSVIKNLQIRVNELETRASNLGLITQ